MGIVSCANAMDERMIAIPSMQGKFILIEDIILHFISNIFSKYTIKIKVSSELQEVLILMKMITL